MVTDLAKDLYYLETGGAERLGVVALEKGAQRWVAVFSERAAARRLAKLAPPGVAVGVAPAGDPRAREEFLLACLQAGAEQLLLDPPADVEGASPSARTSVHDALAYVRSLRTGTACL